MSEYARFEEDGGTAGDKESTAATEGLHLPEPRRDEQGTTTRRRATGGTRPRTAGPDWRTVIASALAAALVAAGVAVPISMAEFDQQASSAAAPPVQTTEGESVTAIARAVAPSIAQIGVTVPGGQGEGSGVVFKEDGYVLTNHHVVADATVVEVSLPDGTTAPATVVGTDPSSDMAVVEIDKTGLPVPAFASAAPQVGDTAVAIGSPFGLQGSVTAGIVSALGRTVPTEGAPLVDLIQTDAPINPGNSGGALVNGRGEVMGINTAILSQSGASTGIDFAIPVQTAIPIAEQLMTEGSVSHGFLGMAGQTRPSPSSTRSALEREPS
jgi:S1-C subfamily serine protease